MAIVRCAGRFCWATWAMRKVNGAAFYRKRDNCIDNLLVSANFRADRVNEINHEINEEQIFR